MKYLKSSSYFLWPKYPYLLNAHNFEFFISCFYGGDKQIYIDIDLPEDFFTSTKGLTKEFEIKDGSDKLNGKYLAEVYYSLEGKLILKLQKILLKNRIYEIVDLPLTKMEDPQYLIKATTFLSANNVINLGILKKN